MGSQRVAHNSATNTLHSATNTLTLNLYPAASLTRCAVSGLLSHSAHSTHCDHRSPHGHPWLCGCCSAALSAWVRSSALGRYNVQKEGTRVEVEALFSQECSFPSPCLDRQTPGLSATPGNVWATERGAALTHLREEDTSQVAEPRPAQGSHSTDH